MDFRGLIFLQVFLPKAINESPYVACYLLQAAGRWFEVKMTRFEPLVQRTCDTCYTCDIKVFRGKLRLCDGRVGGALTRVFDDGRLAKAIMKVRCQERVIGVLVGIVLAAAVGGNGNALMAQPTYSSNVVGYVNLVVPKGFSIIANPLLAATNTISELFNPASTPEGTILYKFSNATGLYSINALEFGEWSAPNQTLVPGEGAFIWVPRTVPGIGFTNLFVGEVYTGPVVIPLGLSIISCPIPRAGLVTTDLGLPPSDYYDVFLFNNATGGYSIRSFEFELWSAEPFVVIGQGFFIRRRDSPITWMPVIPWARAFTVVPTEN